MPANGSSNGFAGAVTRLEGLFARSGLEDSVMIITAKRVEKDLFLDLASVVNVYSSEITSSGRMSEMRFLPNFHLKHIRQTRNHS